MPHPKTIALFLLILLLSIASVVCLFCWGLLTFFMGTSYISNIGNTNQYSHGVVLLIAIGWVAWAALVEQVWQCIRSRPYPMRPWMLGALAAGGLIDVVFVGFMLNNYAAKGNQALSLMMLTPALLAALCIALNQKKLRAEARNAVQPQTPDISS